MTLFSGKRRCVTKKINSVSILFHSSLRLAQSRVRAETEFGGLVGLVVLARGVEAFVSLEQFFKLTQLQCRICHLANELNTTIIEGGWLTAVKRQFTNAKMIIVALLDRK